MSHGEGKEISQDLCNLIVENEYDLLFLIKFGNQRFAGITL